MTRFWRTLCLLVLGLALGLGAPLRAFALPAMAAGSMQAELGMDGMPCHAPMGAAATEAAAESQEAPPCPHCSHGQSGWGCGHCAGCLLGAALAAPGACGLMLSEASAQCWMAAPVVASTPRTLAVPTPPPKAAAVR